MTERGEQGEWKNQSKRQRRPFRERERERDEMKKNGRNMKVWRDDKGEEGEVMDELGRKER